MSGVDSSPTATRGDDKKDSSKGAASCNPDISSGIVKARTAPVGSNSAGEQFIVVTYSTLSADPPKQQEVGQGASATKRTEYIT